MIPSRIIRIVRYQRGRSLSRPYPNQLGCCHGTNHSGKHGDTISCCRRNDKSTATHHVQMKSILHTTGTQFRRNGLMVTVCTQKYRIPRTQIRGGIRSIDRCNSRAAKTPGLTVQQYKMTSLAWCRESTYMEYQKSNIGEYSLHVSEYMGSDTERPRQSWFYCGTPERNMGPASRRIADTRITRLGYQNTDLIRVPSLSELSMIYHTELVCIHRESESAGCASTEDSLHMMTGVARELCREGLNSNSMNSINSLDQ